MRHTYYYKSASSAPPPVFSPLSVGLPMKAWFDPSLSANVTKDGSNFLSGLADLSLNSNAASQSTGSLQPKWVASDLNGLGTVLWDGSDDYMEFSVGSTLSTFSAFALVKSTTNRQYNFIWGPDNSAGAHTGLAFEVSSSDNLDVWANNLGAYGASTAGSFSTSSWLRTLTTYDGTTVRIYINNVLRGSQAVVSDGFYSGARLGFGPGFYTWQGSTAEEGFYSGVISPADALLLDNYLVTKWGL